ncbi:MAG: hypothetical protein KPEEDBHJ_01287 [Anaerolineales bacterium]|nr:hypothetical protein [Anaerolineales bacterium]
MQVKISTTLPCSPERAWREIQLIKLLMHVAYPLVAFEPVEPNVFPATWSDASYLVQMRVFGFIPFGEQWAVIKLNREKFELLDDGHSNLIKQWRHKITVQRTANPRRLRALHRYDRHPSGFAHFRSMAFCERIFLSQAKPLAQAYPQRFQISVNRKDRPQVKSKAKAVVEIRSFPRLTVCRHGKFIARSVR